MSATKLAVGECPGCGHISEPPIVPEQWDRHWWCSACQQAKCTAAWQATAAFPRAPVVTGSQIAAYCARVEPHLDLFEAV
jgi:hypothetical protein